MLLYIGQYATLYRSVYYFYRAKAAYLLIISHERFSPTSGVQQGQAGQGVIFLQEMPRRKTRCSV